MEKNLNNRKEKKIIDFEVGDRVRVKKDIIVDKFYNGWKFNENMLEFKGRILTIDKKRYSKEFYIKEDSHMFIWTIGMLEKVEYTYEDLVKSPIGTKVFFESNNVLLKTDENYYENEQFYRNDEDLKGLKDNSGECKLGKIIKIEEPIYKTVYENKEILDDIEKEYLRNIIKPFRDKVVCIMKVDYVNGECITIIMESEYDSFDLPCFKKGTMYKGMVEGKEYSLKELGL